MKIGSHCIGFLSTSPQGGDLFSSCLTRTSHAGRHRICQKNQNEKCTFDNENCLYHNDGKVEKGKNASNRQENNKSRFGLVLKNKVITFGDFQLCSGGRKFPIEILFPCGVKCVAHSCGAKPYFPIFSRDSRASLCVAKSDHVFGKSRVLNQLSH